MVEFPYKSSTEVPKHQSKHIPAASVANASGSLQTPLSELTRRSDFHLFYQDYRAASLPIECWSLKERAPQANSMGFELQPLENRMTLPAQAGASVLARQ